MITCQIITINHMNNTVQTITVEAAKQSSLFPFTPGAETSITLHNGDKIPCAICSDPYDRRTYELLPLVESESLRTLSKGAVVDVTRPRNPFPLLHCPELILIAGGRGIGQLLTMARERSRLAMPFELHYITTEQTEGLFIDELHDLASLADSRLYLYDGEEAAGLFAPEYVLGEFDNRKHVYVSGDSDLVWQTMIASGRAGWRAAHVHSTELPDALNAPANGLPLAAEPKPALAPVYQLFR